MGEAQGKIKLFFRALAEHFRLQVFAVSVNDMDASVVQIDFYPLPCIVGDFSEKFRGDLHDLGLAVFFVLLFGAFQNFFCKSVFQP